MKYKIINFFRRNINSVMTFVATERHSREGGNPGSKRFSGSPIKSGMTSYAVGASSSSDLVEGFQSSFQRNILKYHLIVLQIIIALFIDLHATEQPHKKTLFMITSQEQYSWTQTTTTYDVIIYDTLETLGTALINYFKTIIQSPKEPSKPPLVVFDIDDTAITKKKLLLAQHNHAPKNYISRFMPIKPILDLYKSLINMGYKIAFVTWRLDTPCSRKKTLKQLSENGYRHFEKLYMRPKNWLKTRPEYKEHARTELAHTYQITGTIDDRFDNLEGMHTGSCIVWVSS